MLLRPAISGLHLWFIRLWLTHSNIEIHKTREQQHTIHKTTLQFLIEQCQTLRKRKRMHKIQEEQPDNPQKKKKITQHSVHHERHDVLAEVGRGMPRDEKRFMSRFVPVRVGWVSTPSKKTILERSTRQRKRCNNTQART